MKKVLFSILLVCSVFFLTACGSNKLIGTWEGETNDGLKTTFTFEKKNVVKYENEFGFSSEGTYEIKDDIVTIELKLWSEKKEYKFEIKDKKLYLTATDKYSPSYKGMTKKK